MSEVGEKGGGDVNREKEWKEKLANFLRPYITIILQCLVPALYLSNINK